MYLKLFLVLALTTSLCLGQCSRWARDSDSDTVSRERINSVFGANPLTITSFQGYIYPTLKTDQICLYEVQAPDGYCIDYTITSLFITTHGNATASVIDGSGVFGGTYIETRTAAFIHGGAYSGMSVGHTTSNVMGVIVASSAPLSSVDGGSTFTFSLHFKIRKCNEAVTPFADLMAITTPEYQ